MFQMEINEKKLYSVLVSSGSLLSELVKYWKDLLEEEHKALQSLAISALTDDSRVPFAQVRKGRCEMLQDLIDRAEYYKNIK